MSFVLTVRKSFSSKLGLNLKFSITSILPSIFLYSNWKYNIPISISAPQFFLIKTREKKWVVFIQTHIISYKI